MTNLSVRAEPQQPPRHALPTMYDLPSEYPEEPGLPDDFHSLQIEFLRLTFQPRNWYPHLVFNGFDMNIYYDVKHPNWHKRPDWFGVVGVPPLYEGRDMRLSYVMWQEEVVPLVVVELLSPGTEDEDLGEKVGEAGKPPTKWDVYEQILKVPYYVVFSRYTDEMQAFRLEGDRYVVAELTDGHLLIPSIELSLGVWQGTFRNVNRLWLRWMTLEGDLILTPKEEAVNAEQKAVNAEQKAANAEQKAANAEQKAANAEQKAANAEQKAANAEQKAADAQQKAADAQQRADRLAARLRELGIDPNQLS